MQFNATQLGGGIQVYRILSMAKQEIFDKNKCKEALQKHVRKRRYR